MLKGLRIPPEGISMEKVEEALIKEALAMTGGNQTKASRLLDMSRDSLRYRMRKFGIDQLMSASFRKGHTGQSNQDGNKLFEADRGSLREKIAGQEIGKERRTAERKQIGCQACIGEDRSKTGGFAMGTILDISIEGVRFSVPNGQKLEIKTDGETTEFSISFSLPDNHWPVGAKCRPVRIVESADEVQIGAMFVDTDIRSYHALRQYLN